MREDTVTTKVYNFDELSDKAKETAIENFSDCNVNYDWWESTYEDAKTIGLRITSFDLDRSRHAKGEWVDSGEETARLILENHGKSCETHGNAICYLAERSTLIAKWSDGIKLDEVHEDNEYDFDQECDELDTEFLKTICEDYSIMLQKESEYLQSEEAIIETIEANEWEFTVGGILY